MLKTIGFGRVTRDPELRRTPSGTAVADFGLATNKRWTGQDGKKREITTFTDWTVWNGSSENFCKLVTKGDLIYVEGEPTVDSWEDKTDGSKRSKTKFTVVAWNLLAKKKDDSAEVHEGETETSAPKESEKPAAKRGRPAKTENKKAIEEDLEDDGIPF